VAANGERAAMTVGLASSVILLTQIFRILIGINFLSATSFTPPFGGAGTLVHARPERMIALP
jgi:hypothetical protein